MKPGSITHTERKAEKLDLTAPSKKKDINQSINQSETTAVKPKCVIPVKSLCNTQQPSKRQPLIVLSAGVHRPVIHFPVNDSICLTDLRTAAEGDRHEGSEKGKVAWRKHKRRSENL